VQTNRSTPSRFTARPIAQPFLEKVYRLPRPGLWHEDYCRFWHLDLASLTDAELAMELSGLWHRICLERPRADSWLWLRRQAIFAEKDRRRRWGRRR
jgi:hypothetical protein